MGHAKAMIDWAPGTTLEGDLWRVGAVSAWRCPLMAFGSPVEKERRLEPEWKFLSGQQSKAREVRPTPFCHAINY